jgi:subtilase family protein
VCFALTPWVDTVNADFLWQQGYDGTGVEIGVIDLFFADSSHSAIDGNFLGSQKFVNGAAWIGDHATSVTGAAASQDATRRGVAYGSGWWTAQTTNRGSITNQRTQTVAAETFAQGLGNLNGNPAEVLTLSIGLGGANSAIDQWSLGLDHIVAINGTTICVAAGNDGPNPSTISGIPPGAYNILTVGATGGSGANIAQDYTQIAPYSSRGPTTDGRSKPDIVAPGSLLELPTPGGGWAVGSGTSFATPMVAGGTALLIDMGRDRGLDTDALVIKSVLMNSAHKLAGWTHTASAPLDPNFGAGQMDLEAAYYQYNAGEHGPGTVETIGWDHGSVLAGSDNNYQIDLNMPSGAQLTATLVWNRQVSSSTADIQTTVYTASPLSNLDLLLSRLGDASSPVAASLSTVDNVEHLFFSIPSQGHYTLDVRSIVGANVDPVDYGLAWNIVLPTTFVPGDYNQNGVVDAADYAVWRKGLGTTFTSADYDVWRAHFGQIAGSGASASANVAISEPATLVLLMFAATNWCLRRG